MAIYEFYSSRSDHIVTENLIQVYILIDKIWNIQIFTKSSLLALITTADNSMILNTKPSAVFDFYSK